MRSGSGPRWSDPVLWLALALAAPLRFLGLGTPSLWLDEALSARAAALPPAGLLAAAGADLHPPGYYLLLHLWTAPYAPNAAGFPGEWALRSLSALASLALVPIAFWLGHAWAAAPERRGPTARAAAWLAALSPFAISLGHEARMYALLSLLLAAQFALWTRLRDGRGGAVAWGTLTLVAAAGMWVHYHALIFTAALCAASWLRAPGGSRRFGGRFSIAAGVALLSFAPWLPRVGEQAAAGVRNWITFGRSPFIVPRTLAAFVRGDDVSATELGLWMLPVVFLLWRGARSGGSALVVPLLLPLVIAYVSARAFGLQIFGVRYFGGSAVVAWVLLARGACGVEPGRWRRWTVAAAALVLVAAGIGIASGSGAPSGRGEAWRELVRGVEAGSAPGTPVAFPFAAPLAPFAYYARPGHLTLVGGISPGGDGGASLTPALLRAAGGGPAGPRALWWVPYLEDLYDPGQLGRSFFLQHGFTEGTPPVTAGRLEAIPFRRDAEAR